MEKSEYIILELNDTMPRKKKRYRVVYVCDHCGSVNTTKAKKTPKAPARDHQGCGSTQTRKIKANKVYV